MTANQLRRAQERYERDLQGARERRDEIIHAALSDGWAQQAIANAMGLTKGRISQIVQGTR